MTWVTSKDAVTVALCQTTTCSHAHEWRARLPDVLLSSHLQVQWRHPSSNTAPAPASSIDVCSPAQPAPALWSTPPFRQHHAADRTARVLRTGWTESSPLRRHRDMPAPAQVPSPATAHPNLHAPNRTHSQEPRATWLQPLSWLRVCPSCCSPALAQEGKY